MTPETTTSRNTAKDFEPLARESFFVAVCDCDESSFVTNIGCSHPFHVAPQSVLGAGGEEQEEAL